jgi:hypothetical protein
VKNDIDADGVVRALRFAIHRKKAEASPIPYDVTLLQSAIILRCLFCGPSGLNRPTTEVDRFVRPTPWRVRTRTLTTGGVRDE